MPDRAHRVEELPRTMDQRASAEILVLGQIRDSLVSLTTSLTDVRERVIRIEASDVAAHIARVESYISKKEEETEKIRADGFARIHRLEMENARWKGLFAPLAILGSAFLSGLVTWVIRSLPAAGGG